MSDVVRITDGVLYLGYDQHSDGVFAAIGDVVVWWEQTFDSLDQLLPGLSGKTFTIHYGEATEDQARQIAAINGDDYDE